MRTSPQESWSGSSGLAGLGLVLGTPWGFELAWVPGTVLLYHGIGFWVWTGNQRRASQRLATGEPFFRAAWTVANLVTGSLASWVAWTAP